jgi:hypothetical protein
VDVIKVDVEGAEYLAPWTAEDAAAFSSESRDGVVPSQLAAMNTTAEDLVSLMKELGYGPHKQVNNTNWEWTFK